MLLELKVNNYALIRDLSFAPGKGLNTITGETGAGKSILLGALGLILGERADSSSLLQPDEKCVVEGSFNIAGYPIQDFFDRNDIDYDIQTVLRREVTVAGKSRAFINDTPVTLQTLRELGDFLVDIHSQRESIALFEKSFQMALLDKFAENEKLLYDYQRHYKLLREQQTALDLLKEKQQRLSLDMEFRQFLFDELNEADLRSGEMTELEQEGQLLENAAEVKSVLQEAVYVLKGNEQAVGDQLGAIMGKLSKLQIGDSFQSLKDRLKEAIIEIKDIASELETLEEKTNEDPQRLIAVQDRMSQLFRILKKHGANDENDLIALREKLKSELSHDISISEEILNLEITIKELEETCQQLADTLHDRREKIKSSIENRINTELAELAMPHARLNIEIVNLGKLLSDGKDGVSFLFASNKGIPFQLLSKSASGGELSRLMLVLKTLLAEKMQLPTIIFDEIDTGVSGEVAHLVGQKMQKLANGLQVIAITHLPQIAAKGQQQYLVYKNESSGSTQTLLRKLKDEERPLEIAKMISGENPSSSALANARELLGIAVR
jgi:DNA repair protein RecN (Recombination protein N)